MPGYNNWLLFSATVEAALATLGAPWDRMRVDYALRQHDQWYKGDGVYGDGPSFHWDYYNSFVIHPMLLDVLDTFRDEAPAWKDLAAREEQRARRYAAIQERLIAPDGTFPAIGRSLAYRFGAFQVLAQMALRHALPDEVAAGAGPRRADGRHPPDDRGAGDLRRERLAADRLLRASAGRRRAYISTGSLYLCSVGLLAARPAAVGRVLVRAAAALDVRPRVVGEAVPDRPRAQRVISDDQLNRSTRAREFSCFLFLNSRRLWFLVWFWFFWSSSSRSPVLLF